MNLLTECDMNQDQQPFNNFLIQIEIMQTRRLNINRKVISHAYRWCFMPGHTADTDRWTEIESFTISCVTILWLMCVVMECREIVQKIRPARKRQSWPEFDVVGRWTLHKVWLVNRFENWSTVFNSLELQGNFVGAVWHVGCIGKLGGSKAFYFCKKLNLKMWFENTLEVDCTHKLFRQKLNIHGINCPVSRPTLLIIKLNNKTFLSASEWLRSINYRLLPLRF